MEIQNQLYYALLYEQVTIHHENMDGKNKTKQNKTQAWNTYVKTYRLYDAQE